MSSLYSSLYTNIEQSKKLLELGLSSDTADVHWKLGIVDTLNIDDNGEFRNYDSIPAWSLNTLLNLIPTKLVPTLTRGSDFPEKSDDWFCYLDDNAHFVMCHSSSQIEAVYDVVVYLLKNKYIKI